jgi:hypothetical protein
MRGLLHVQVLLRSRRRRRLTAAFRRTPRQCHTVIAQPFMRGLLHVQVELLRSRRSRRIRPLQ